MRAFPLQQKAALRAVITVAVAAATLCATATPAAAGCGAVSSTDFAPAAWQPRVMEGSLPAVYRSGAEALVRVVDQESSSAGIVGLWRFTFVSDGSAYPGPVPYGATVDFGTVIWHGDGTEIMFSGSRPPSSGDVCMGVWQQTGNRPSG